MISILWGLKARGRVFFPSFSSNLLPSPWEDACPSRGLVSWREEAPSTSSVQANPH